MGADELQWVLSVHLFACDLSCIENKYVFHVKKIWREKAKIIEKGIRKIKWNVGLEYQVEKGAYGGGQLPLKTFEKAIWKPMIVDAS